MEQVVVLGMFLILASAIIYLGISPVCSHLDTLVFYTKLTYQREKEKEKHRRYELETEIELLRIENDKLKAKLNEQSCSIKRR